jgi:hypothetical protein
MFCGPTLDAMPTTFTTTEDGLCDEILTLCAPLNVTEVISEPLPRC